jgi:hypothetical protein
MTWRPADNEVATAVAVYFVKELLPRGSSAKICYAKRSAAHRSDVADVSGKIRRIHADAFDARWIVISGVDQLSVGRLQGSF